MTPFPRLSALTTDTQRAITIAMLCCQKWMAERANNGLPFLYRNPTEIYSFVVTTGGLSPTIEDEAAVLAVFTKEDPNS